EYGGRLDTVHQSEEIKFELWKVIYGIWDHVKNSGKFPQSENLTLEWVGTIPGKRESRRFEGDYMITQKDIVEQRDHYDRVSFGGWAMDLHPADGIYSELSSCTQWHSKGIYSIPYRCFYSKDIENLFLAGRIISATHVAFGSTRVMLTGAQNAQVAGMAASLCIKNNWRPKNLAEKEKIPLLQLALMKAGQSIPRLAIEDIDDLVGKAKISASSELKISKINPSGEWKALKFSTAQLLPLFADSSYNVTVKIKASMNTSLTVKLKSSSKSSHFTPDVELQSKTFTLTEGTQEITFSLDKPMDKDRYVYVCFMKNEVVEIPMSEERFTGVMTTMQKVNKAVSNYGAQEPPKGIGIEAFEFWTPERAPDCKNIAMAIEPAIAVYGAAHLKNSYLRPASDKLNTSWAADLKDEYPKLTLTWDSKQSIKQLRLFFDGDFDHPLESIYMPHPNSVVNFVVSDYKIYDDNDNLIHETNGNHQALNHINFDKPIVTKAMTLIFRRPQTNIPVALFKVSAYS
ncbi:MAG: FAD-dependent oxidoreductase, partial [Cyclobacteriaceae bacterium]|nr:FAD-dependent oxidoreductase [Cyclobacteriaceae bacterium]